MASCEFFAGHETLREAGAHAAPREEIREVLLGREPEDEIAQEHSPDAISNLDSIVHGISRQCKGGWQVQRGMVEMPIARLSRR